MNFYLKWGLCVCVRETVHRNTVVLELLPMSFPSSVGGFNIVANLSRLLLWGKESLGPSDSLWQKQLCLSCGWLVHYERFTGFQKINGLHLLYEQRLSEMTAWSLLITELVFRILLIMCICGELLLNQVDIISLYSWEVRIGGTAFVIFWAFCYLNFVNAAAEWMPGRLGLICVSWRYAGKLIQGIISMKQESFND